MVIAETQHSETQAGGKAGLRSRFRRREICPERETYTTRFKFQPQFAEKKRNEQRQNQDATTVPAKRPAASCPPRPRPPLRTGQPRSRDPRANVCAVCVFDARTASGSGPRIAACSLRSPACKFLAVNRDWMGRPPRGCKPFLLITDLFFSASFLLFR